jgi:hypothetical protein
MKSFWWLTLPKKASSISNWLAIVITDGYFLLTFENKLQTWLSPLSILLGVLIGALRPGYDFIPVEVYYLFLGFLFLGMLSSHLGLMLLTGFAIGDLITTEEIFLSNDINLQVRAILAKIHEYLIFGIAMVHIPVLSKQIIAGMVQSVIPLLHKRINTTFARWTFFSFISLVHLIITGCLLAMWSQAMVLLIRAVYVNIITGGTPTVKVVRLFQYDWHLIVIAGIIATFFRIIGQWFGVVSNPAGEKSEVYEKKASEFLYKQGLIDVLPRWISAILKGLLLTFLLWGAFQDWIEINIFFASAVILYLVHGYIGNLSIWPAWVLKLWNRPEWVRLIIALVSSFIVFKYLLKELYSSANPTFWAILITTLVSLGIFSLLLPVKDLKTKKAL